MLLIDPNFLFRCVEKISGRIEVDVPGSYCDPADLPSEEEDCTLFCPDECVLAEWTEWSSCQSVSRGWVVRIQSQAQLLGFPN